MPNLTPHAYSGRQSAHGTTARPAAVSASGPRAKAPKPDTAALWDPPSGATARPLESLASLSGLPTADYGRGFLALKIGCGDRIRTCDLQFMRLASYRAPRRRPVRWPFRASLSGFWPPVGAPCLPVSGIAIQTVQPETALVAAREGTGSQVTGSDLLSAQDRAGSYRHGNLSLVPS